MLVRVMRAGKGAGSCRVSGVSRSSAGGSSVTIRSTSVSNRRKGGAKMAWQHDSRRQQAFSNRSRLRAIRTFSGDIVGEVSSNKCSRGSGTCLALGLAHLVVQPNVVELVELQRVGGRQHARGRLEHVRLRLLRARGGARRPTRGACGGRRAVPARRRRAAPAYRPCFVLPQFNPSVYAKSRGFASARVRAIVGA